MEFKEGDIVCLKSGSPNMTVKDVEIGIYVHVIYWNAALSKFVNETFMANQLDKIEKVE